MNERQNRVSELIAGYILFEIGSTTLFFIGAEAKQDAWLAMLISAALGFVLVLIYWGTFQMDPKRNLFQLFSHYLGKWPGAMLTILYAVYFAYEASRNLRDLAELAAFALLNRTPLFVITLLAILVIGNSARYGARIALQLCLALLPIVIISYSALILAIIGKGMLSFEYMLPVLEQGMGPVLQAAVPEIISFPFAQTLLFLVYFPLISNTKKLRKSFFLTYGIVALFLTIVNQINVLVLGPTLAEMMTFPLLEVVQLIELAEVFERMDVLFVLVLFIGLGFKVLFFYVGAVTGISEISGTGYKRWVIPVGLFIFASSLTSPNFSHHMWVGIDVVLNQVYPYIQMAIPIFLFLVMLFRRKKRLQP